MRDDETSHLTTPEGTIVAYERPVLTHLGNARQLLAGSDGSIVDAGDPDNPQQATPP